MRPGYIPQIAVLVAAILTFGFVSFGWDGGMTWPLAMFLSAKYSGVYAILEIGLSLSGYYGDDSKRIYASISRVITAFGMTTSLVLLIGIYETKDFNS